MSDTLYIPANLDNMREHYESGIFAVSVCDPDERCSANPADYFWLGGGEILTDSFGRAMILARERREVICLDTRGHGRAWSEL